jgi:thiamine phosphate synthase YjbQ (UPF0047 family)
MVFQREIQLQTSGHRQMHDLTDEIAEIVSASGVRSGLAHIFKVPLHHLYLRMASVFRGSIKPTE